MGCHKNLSSQNHCRLWGDGYKYHSWTSLPASRTYGHLTHRLRMMETCDVRTFRKRRRFRACRRPSRRWRPNWTRSRTDLRKQAPNSRIPRNSCKRSVNKTSATHLRCARKQQEIQLKASEVGCRCLSRNSEVPNWNRPIHQMHQDSCISEYVLWAKMLAEQTKRPNIIRPFPLTMPHLHAGEIM